MAAFDPRLIDKVRDYVCRVYQKEMKPELAYHNLQHTLEVVAACHEVGTATALKPAEKEVLFLAAWFHDIGYKNTLVNHEQDSVVQATEFLTKLNYPADKIAQVCACILATKMPQAPKDPIAEVLCDADLFNLSLPDFYNVSLKLRKEWLEVAEKQYTDLEWAEQNLAFLENHTYFTYYGKTHLAAGKAENIKVMKMVVDGKMKAKPIPPKNRRTGW